MDLVTSGISEIRERSIVDQDGVEREVDAIIFGTGFKVTDYVSAMQIRGSGGVDLNTVWQQSVRNYRLSRPPASSRPNPRSTASRS